MYNRRLDSFRSSSQRRYKYTCKTTVEESLSIISENINDYIRSFYFTETRCSHRTLVEFSSTNCLPIPFIFRSQFHPFQYAYIRVYVFDNARLFENLPGKRFNKIIIIYLVVNEIIREMVYFRNDTNIPYEK